MLEDNIKSPLAKNGFGRFGGVKENPKQLFAVILQHLDDNKAVSREAIARERVIRDFIHNVDAGHVALHVTDKMNAILNGIHTTLVMRAAEEMSKNNHIDPQSYEIRDLLKLVCSMFNQSNEDIASLCKIVDCLLTYPEEAFEDGLSWTRCLYVCG